MKYLGYFWIFICVVLLVFTLIVFDGDSKSDLVIFLFWGMVVLTFPVGLIANLLIAAVAYYEIGFLSYFLSGVSYVSLICYWLLFFVFGYFQWFKVLPFIVKRISKSIESESVDKKERED